MDDAELEVDPVSGDELAGRSRRGRERESFGRLRPFDFFHAA